MVKSLLIAMNIIIHPITLDKFYTFPRPEQFEFITIDIIKLEATVKYLYVMDEINAKLLEEYAAIRIAKGSGNSKSKDEVEMSSVNRLQNMAIYHYEHALQLIPSSTTNNARYEALKSLSASIAADPSNGMDYSYNMHVDGDMEEEFMRARSASKQRPTSTKRSKLFGCCQS